MDRDEVGHETTEKILENWARLVGKFVIDANFLKELENYTSKESYLNKFLVKSLIWK